MLKNMGPQAGQGRFDSAAAGGNDKAKARKDDRSGLMVQADKVAAAQARVRTAVCGQGCLCAGGANSGYKVRLSLLAVTRACKPEVKA